MHKRLNRNKLALRILEISYKHKLSHIGSCLTILPILIEIFEAKFDDDIFILSCGHAGLAYYAILEQLHEEVDAEDLFLKSGIHPERGMLDKEYFDFTTGSLGMGIGAAVGFALADRERDVYCVISDGELAEGVVYESLNFIKKHKLNNLKVYVNANGYGAYDSIDLYGLYNLEDRVKVLCPQVKFRRTSKELVTFGVSYLNGLNGHYDTLDKGHYEYAKDFLTNS